MISYAEAKAAKERLQELHGGLGAVHEARSLRDPDKHPQSNTVGFEVAVDEAGSYFVRKLVRAKLPPEEVHAEALAPGSIDGVPVKVAAVGEVRAYKERCAPKVKLREAPGRRIPERTAKPSAAPGVWTSRETPAKGGASIGHFQITAGTIGGLCAVRDGGLLKLAVLSNNHVLGNSNLGKPRDPIIQPGAVDDGTMPADKVAELLKFVPLKWGGAANSVDCALGWTRWANISPQHHSFTISPSPAVPSLGMDVMKDGRTTGHTRGRVVGLDADVVVSYEPEGGNASFHGQVRVTGFGGASFSQPGDSGSLIVTAAGAHPVLLLFAGGQDPDGTDSTFACPIRLVMDALGIERFLNAVE